MAKKYTKGDIYKQATRPEKYAQSGKKLKSYFQHFLPDGASGNDADLAPSQTKIGGNSRDNCRIGRTFYGRFFHGHHVACGIDFLYCFLLRPRFYLNKNLHCRIKRYVRRRAFGSPSSSGAEGDRTLDLVNAIHALSQLSYGPEKPLSAILQKIPNNRWKVKEICRIFA